MVTLNHNPRKHSGSSVLELLVAVVIMTVAMAAIAELASVLTMASLTTNNRVTGLEAARIAIHRISADVRQARAVGDFYGVAADKLNFPSVQNPKYATSPPATPPGWRPIKLSGTVLVLQIPVTYEDPTDSQNPTNGLPTIIPKDYYSPGIPPSNCENLDTVVYEVVPDNNRAGEFILQVVRYPGEQLVTLPSKFVAGTNTPQTILKGLIGPLSTADGTIPSVFSYFAPTSSALPYARLLTPPAAPEFIRGVGIDLEIKNTGRTIAEQDGRFPSFLGIHSEAFMRANVGTTLKNTLVLP